jgi:hypothetical protein
VDYGVKLQTTRLHSGDTTGLVVRKVKVIGTGKKRRAVEEYVVDRRLLAIMKELGRLEELAAWLVGDLPPAKRR